MAVAILVAALAAGAAPAAASIQLGAYVRDAPGSGQVLDDYVNLVGQKPAIVMWYRSLDRPLMYSSEIANLSARGQTPMVSLEPVDATGADIPLSRIAAGEYDNYLRQAAAVARSWDGRILIRFAYEMNLSPGAGIPWGGGQGAFAGNTAADYVAAWRHAVGIFRAEGATNAEWVWAPNIDDGGLPFSQYFPGDEWVDAVGLDGYNWGSAFAATGHSWLSVADTFSSSYATLTQLSSKPVMITEIGSAEVGGDKAEWILRGFLDEIPRLFPRVSAVVWFNVRKEADWRVDSSPAALAAFRTVAASSLYGGPVPYQPLAVEPPPPPRIENLNVTRQIRSASPPQVQEKRRAKPKRVRRRGTIRYRLARAARVRIRIQRRGKPARPLVLHRRGHAGRNVVRFSARTKGRKLAPGRYRVSITALASGRRSAARRAGFRVLPR
ncbi:MAG TPA: glycosyl hydrolase [Solirubrobacterales bacterium]|nr:glycosyl hydrolase [Solirubrobacterales bacterium]